MSEDIFDREIRKSQGVVDADGDKSKSMRVFSRAGKDDSILNITTTPAKKRTSATLIDDSDEEKIQPDTKKSRRGSLGADGMNINIIYKHTFSNIFFQRTIVTYQIGANIVCCSTRPKEFSSGGNTAAFRR